MRRSWRYFVFFFLVIIQEPVVYSQSCTVTSAAKATLCPDQVVCPCPSGSDCYPSIIVPDPGFTILSFRLFAFNLSGNEEEGEECVNTGNVFNPCVKSKIARMTDESSLYFYCIKVKSNAGAILILRSFSVNIKDRKIVVKYDE
jgi:hypothetical protein